MIERSESEVTVKALANRILRLCGEMHRGGADPSDVLQAVGAALVAECNFFGIDPKTVLDSFQILKQAQIPVGEGPKSS